MEALDLSGLFSPFAVGKLNLANRFVMPAMQRGWAENGRPLPAMISYYRRRVEGGVALVISEGAVVDHPSAEGHPRLPRFCEETLDAWKPCVQAVQAAGGGMLAQISHPGAMRKDGVFEWRVETPSLSPSGLCRAGESNGRAATAGELDEIKHAFASAARLARDAGFDGVELHGCHGFFLDEFLWPATNRRDDQYGGVHIEGRARYPAEVVAAIRAATGSDFIICYRFSQWKEIDYDARIVETPEDLTILLTMLAAAGVDIFHPSARRFFRPEWPGSPLGLAGWTKRLGSRPVIVVGSVGLDIDVMESFAGAAEARFAGESALRELARRFDNQEFDLVSVGRSAIADAQWVHKIRDRRFSEIRLFQRDMLNGMEAEGVAFQNSARAWPREPDLSGLFRPFTLKRITLANRFVMPAMQRGWCVDGVPLPKMADYYRARVEGGTALIIGEAAAIDHPSSTGQSPAAHLFGPALKGWARCVRAVKDAGGHMFLQLWHEGAMRREGTGGPKPLAPTLSPSGLVWKGRCNGRAAAAKDLDDIRDAYVRGARAAQDMGADGVEIHGAHGFLLDQFLWSETNARTDGRGGDDPRARVSYPAEIVAAIRSAVGPDFVIGWRFSQWKEVDFAARIAHSPEELGTILTALRAAGVDMFHASARRFHIPEWPGSDLGVAGWAKKLTDAPIIAIGCVGIEQDVIDNTRGQDSKPTRPGALDELARRFARGEFDLVAAGRAMIGDAEWVNKIREGRYADIRPFSRDILEQVDWDLSLMMEGLARAGA
jgi:2,4-dienoyl-CoA reductase-like NADH-dependent reductase (Old Yellow Enzyme family)